MEGLNCSIPKNKKLLECKTRPKPLIPYFGGKTRVSDQIIQTFPDHQTFVEPFAGGASVYWANTIANNFVINDLDKDIYNLYKTAKNSPGTVKSCELNGVSKEEFNRMRDKSNKSACDVIKLHKHAFSGAPKNGWARKDKHFVNRFGDKHIEKLKKTVVLNQGFDKVMLRYDKKGVVMYLDPPYVKAGGAYNTTGVSPQEVCDVMRKIKNAKVILSYDNHPEVRKACKGFKFKKLKFPYSSGNNSWGKNIDKTELLIEN